MTVQRRIGFLMVLFGPIGAYLAIFSWKVAMFTISFHLMGIGAILFIGTKE